MVFSSAGAVPYICAEQSISLGFSLGRLLFSAKINGCTWGDSNKLASRKQNCEMALVISGASLSPLQQKLNMFHNGDISKQETQCALTTGNSQYNRDVSPQA